VNTKQLTSLDCENVVSAVIRARNAAWHLQRCLAGLKRQILPGSLKLQIIVVDNGSTDDTILVARRYGASIVPMKPEEFTWGSALNKGIALAVGQTVLLLSSDTYAPDTGWLDEMLKPFADPDVAAVYGRQIPYRDAPVDERVRLKKYFPPSSLRFNNKDSNAHPSGRGIIVSNACAAIRREVWQELPYDEKITAGEEGLWSCEVLQRGYTIVYQASAKVYHSHKDNPMKQAWRHWELRAREDLFDNGEKSEHQTLRWLGAFAKRRLQNCLYPGLPTASRIKGIAVLPLELSAFALVDLIPKKNIETSKLKRLFWG
jgi:glycosyltransferase involved in cell wall biosynthesis